MSTTLTYGRIKPSAGDRGTWFADLENNIELDDLHNHDGVGSSLLPTSILTKGTSTVTNTGWSSDGSWYYKTISMPSGYSWGSCKISFFMNGGTNNHSEFFPKTVYVSSTSFKLYMPVNNQAVDVLYT